MEKPPRAQLDRSTWIHATLDALSDNGVGSIRVETLAKRLQVTKGSFYWHFKDRQDLLDAVLETWRDGRIRDIIKQTRPEPGQEEAQIYHVINVYSAGRNDKGILIELAMREWARRDPTVRKIVEEVDTARLNCARDLFVACGMQQEEASTRSVLLYAYVFGFSMMNCGNFDGNVDEMKAQIRHIIARNKPPTISR